MTNEIIVNGCGIINMNPVVLTEEDNFPIQDEV